MSKAIQRFSLDVTHPDVQATVRIVQGDDNRQWRFTFTKAGEPFDLPPRCTAMLVGTKPDDTVLQNGLVVQGNEAIYDFGAADPTNHVEQISTVPGSFEIQIILFDEAGNILHLPRMWVVVYASSYTAALVAESESQFGGIKELIARLVEAEGKAEALEKLVTTQGTVTISTTQWTNTTPYRADVFMPGDVFGKGCVVLFLPEDDATKEAAGKAVLSMTIDGTFDYNAPSQDYVVIARAESGVVPTIPLNFRYVVLKTGTEDKALVAMIGVDAVGAGTGNDTTTGVDESAVRAIINQVVPAWARASTKPTYNKSEVGLGNVDNAKQYSESNPPDYPVDSVNGKTGAVQLKASDVGADPSGTAATKVSDHDTYTGSHQDIRLLIKELREQVNKFLDVDDTTRDELSEVLALIDANAGTLASFTSSKVNVTDIINNLTTNVTNKPLSAAQGVALKKLIDTLSSGKLDASALTAAKLADVLGYTPANAANVPTKLSQLTDDSTHRTVTDEEKADWGSRVTKEELEEAVKGTGGNTGGTTTTYVNLVPTSDDGYGAVYNGTGYCDGKRVSTTAAFPYVSDGVGYTLTGFMPFEKVNGVYPDLYVDGGVWTGSNARIMFCDADMKYISTHGYADGTGTSHVIGHFFTLNTGFDDFNNTGTSASTWHVTPNATLNAIDGIKYIRVSLYGSGADLSISVLKTVSSDAEPGADVVPSYITEEAQRVAKAAFAQQSGSSLTAIFCSDLHHSTVMSDTETRRAGLKHMGQAMSIIKGRVHIDLLGMLGDLIYDTEDMTVDVARETVQEVNEFLSDAATGVQALRTRGNHDANYYGYYRNGNDESYLLSDAQIFANTAIWNNGAEFDAKNRVGGYCYKDFDDRRIRVIVVNTCESKDNSYQISEAQKTWFESTLASTPNGYYVVILSHHPLDWTNESASEVSLMSSVAAYEHMILANIHGHIHNFTVANLGSTSVKRITIPNACYDRNNEYGTNGTTEEFGKEFGEFDSSGTAVTYPKTADSAEDTAFCVVTIDPDAKKVYAVCYGAGYDREVDVPDTVTGAVGGSFPSLTASDIAPAIGTTFPPSQKPASDDIDGSDIDVLNATADDIHAYIDEIVSGKNTVTKEILGKDASGKYDIARYTFANREYCAWVRENYPKMYGWKNGGTVMYTESVSPRVGDKAYDVPYIGGGGGTTTETIPAVMGFVYGQRYSSSGGGFVAHDTLSTLVIPVELDNDITEDNPVTLAIEGALIDVGKNVYYGETNTAPKGQAGFTGAADNKSETITYMTKGKIFIFLNVLTDSTGVTDATTIPNISVTFGDVVIDNVAIGASAAAHATTAEVETEDSGMPITEVKVATVADGTTPNNIHSSRIIGGAEYVRSETDDVEPTVIYTDADDDRNVEATITQDGITYHRYPMGDLGANRTKLIPVFIYANEHGIEAEPTPTVWYEGKTPALIAARLLRDLCSGKQAKNPLYKFIRENCMLVVVPVTNPWGYNHNLSGDMHYNGNDYGGYFNYKLVNINRNYDTPGWPVSILNGEGQHGVYPGSENETQYIMNTMVESGAVVAMSLHTIGNPAGAQPPLGRCAHQGQNPDGSHYDKARMDKVSNFLTEQWGYELTYYDNFSTTTPTEPSINTPDIACKSPSYITQCSAYGGIVEFSMYDPNNISEKQEWKSNVLENSYAQVLNLLAMWLSDYLGGRHK